MAWLVVLPVVAAAWVVRSEPGEVVRSTSTATSAATSSTSSTSTSAPSPPRNEDVEALLGPLRETDAPDPYVAVDGGHAWLFTTNTGYGNVPVWTWQDGRLVAADALPTLPSWARAGRTWAPAVTRVGGHWLLAFTAPTADGRQCIGVATASQPAGPYVPQQSPLVCDVARGGSIDPSFVLDESGVTWLLFKDDGNCCGLPTTLRSVPLTADGLGLAGWPQDLIGADRGWEGDLVEAPTMAHIGDGWLLLYSANRWDEPTYAVGAAWCSTPAGPCTKQPDPILTSDTTTATATATGSGLSGPGGAEFVAGTRYVVFHAWPATRTGYRSGAARTLRLVHITTDTAGEAHVVSR